MKQLLTLYVVCVSYDIICFAVTLKLESACTFNATIRLCALKSSGHCVFRQELFAVKTTKTGDRREWRSKFAKGHMMSQTKQSSVDLCSKRYD